MIKSGVISDKVNIELENDNIIPYLYDLLDSLPNDKYFFETYQKQQFFWHAEKIIEFFVKVLGYVIIYNNIVYFQSEYTSEMIDKVDYIKNGFQLKKMPKMVYKNGKFTKYINPVQQEFERVGFSHSMSEENDLPFWYPRTADIGFKTPNTLITQFTKDEFDLIKAGKWHDIKENSLVERITSNSKNQKEFDLNNDMFVRLGNSSNKFNFETCHIKSINGLYPKLMIMFDDMYFKLEWLQNITLILREYIKTNYHRSTIYNGMPLNTEFRVFYDFDNNKVLGIFNYWDKDTMLENLYDPQDLITFANSIHEIEDDFNNLYPILLEEVRHKLPKAKLTGKWSVDFMFDGKDFVLIDMAHAECSYYYDKVLARQKKYHN